MTNHDIQYGDCCLTVDGAQMTLPFAIADAFISNGIIVVLYKPDAKPETAGQFRNLEAYSMEGSRLWQAELPTSSSFNAYYRIESREPLVADSLDSYSCQIDLNSGRIVSKEFYK